MPPARRASSKGVARGPRSSPGRLITLTVDEAALAIHWAIQRWAPPAGIVTDEDFDATERFLDDLCAGERPQGVHTSGVQAATRRIRACEILLEASNTGQLRDRVEVEDERRACRVLILYMGSLEDWLAQRALLDQVRRN